MSRDQNERKKNHNLKIRNTSFEIVAKFQYLGNPPPKKNENCIHEESQWALNAGNAASSHTGIYLFSSLLYNNMNIKINRIILKWILTK